MADYFSNMTVRGQLGDNVYLVTKHGKHIRLAPKPGSRKNDPVLKAQYQRNSYLNPLAATINAMMKSHCPILKTGEFYTRLLSLFRKEPLNNRFLLLNKIIGLEVHPKNHFPASSSQKIDIRQSAKQITVSIQVKAHPHYNNDKANSYYLVPVLITWPRKGEADMDVQYSDWIDIGNHKPGFDFVFPLQPRIQHWLLGLQMIGGIDHNPIPRVSAEGMKFVEVGSFDAKDKKLLQERLEEKKNTTVRTKKPDDVVRVKARG